MYWYNFPWERVKLFNRNFRWNPICKECGDNSKLKGIGLCVKCYARQRTHKKLGRICKDCGRTDSDVVFRSQSQCASCSSKEQTHAVLGRVCEDCGRTDSETTFQSQSCCVSCGTKKRAHATLGRVCEDCGRTDSETTFQSTTRCRSCHTRQWACANLNRVCESCGRTDSETAFRSSSQCNNCFQKQRGRALLGRECKSCGLLDRDFIQVGREFGSRKDLCRRCAGIRDKNKKRGWEVMCPTNIHIMPPPRFAFNLFSRGKKPRDFPACNCKPGMPDPKPRIIPFEDEPDPYRNYVPYEQRQQLIEERYDMGVSEEQSQIRGHGQTKIKKFDPTGRKGSSRRSPRRSTRGGSSFDIGPRKPRRYNPRNRKWYNPRLLFWLI